MHSPPDDALVAILGPSSRITRRCDIYEEDGTTAFLLSAGFLSGSVSVDQGRDERRTFDLVLDNTLGQVDNYPGHFWYDKVIKLYRGVMYESLTESWLDLPGVSGAYSYTSDKAQLDITGDLDIRGRLAATDWTPASFQVVVGKWTNTGNQRSYLLALDNSPAGQLILYWSDNGTTELSKNSTVATGIADGETKWVRATLDVDNGAAGHDVKFYTSTDGVTWTQLGTTITTAGVTSIFSGTAPVIVGGRSDTVQALAGKVYEVQVRNGIDGSLVANPRFDQQENGVSSFADDNLNSWIMAGTASIKGGERQTTEWETQIGEFLIDNISTQNFPHTTAVVGRDYTKKLLEDKFAFTTTFVQGSALEDVIKDIALNGGITKFIFPTTGETLGRDFVFDADTPRWQAVKELSGSYNYDLFFNEQGYFVMEQYQDPNTAPLSFTYETGELGTLASYSKRASDTRIYNHVVVTGEATNQVSVIAEAENTESSSPTSIANLGRRKTFRYTSSFIYTLKQAQDVADRLLQQVSLETFDLTLEAIVLPWLDVGTIVEFLDPEPLPGEPSRFLLSNFTVPLTLELMSLTGKRVTVVG